MKIVEIIGLLSSIGTLILFVIYFIGRYITMFAVRNTYDDILTIESRDHRDDALQIVDCCVLNENYLSKMYITTTNGIHNLKIYEYIHEDEFTITGKKLVYERKYINTGYTFEIDVTVPEIFITYCVEYELSDFRKVFFNIQYNMRNGVLTEMVEPKHTFRSFCYYMFR